MITQKLIAFKIKTSTLNELNEYCAANNLRRKAVLNDIVKTYLKGVSGFQFHKGTIRTEIDSIKKIN